jgi:hypothetical protein
MQLSVRDRYRSGVRFVLVKNFYLHLVYFCLKKTCNNFHDRAMIFSKRSLVSTAQFYPAHPAGFSRSLLSCFLPLNKKPDN